MSSKRRTPAVNVAQSFIENLAGHRKAAGLTQEELAALASVHRTEVSLLERGRRQPRLGTLVKLPGALALDAGALLEGIAWRPAPSGGGRFVIADRH